MIREDQNLGNVDGQGIGLDPEGLEQGVRIGAIVGEVQKDVEIFTPRGRLSNKLYPIWRINYLRD